MPRLKVDGFWALVPFDVGVGVGDDQVGRLERLDAQRPGRRNRLQGVRETVGVGRVGQPCVGVARTLGNPCLVQGPRAVGVTALEALVDNLHRIAAMRAQGKAMRLITAPYRSRPRPWREWFLREISGQTD